MEIGTEISQKIRSAIKAKLIEQGAYVDDELPDYIMVMVANKKSQKQMTDDLSLFLGTNTEKFTSWLHGLLKKLQSINTDDGSKQKPKDRHKEHKGDKKKHKTSQGEKGAKSGEGSKVRKSSTGEREKTEKKKNEEKVEASSSKSKPVQQGHVEDVPEIKISEDTDEFNEENKEAELKEQKSSATGKPPPVKVAKSDKSSDVKKSGTKISTKDSSSTTSSNNKSKSSSSSTSHRSESKEMRKKPSSFVANIKRKYVEIEDEEEYDPANPAVGSVASIVRGPTRKSSVPKALQANKSLLMKAVTEAEKSVTTSKKTDLPTDIEEPSMRSDRKPVDLKHRLKTAAGLGLLSRSKRSELEGQKYKADIDQGTSEAKKPRRSTEGFENIRYTIQNESVARSKSPPKKVSPKTKAPPVAPSRVAASALREMGQTSKVVVKKEQVSDDETSEEYGPPLPDTRLVQRTQIDESSTDSNPRDSPVDDRSEDNVSPDPEIQLLLDEAHETLDLNDDLLFGTDTNRKFTKTSRSPSPEPRFIVTLDGVDPRTYTTFPEVRQHPVQTVKPVLKQKPVQDLPQQQQQQQPLLQPKQATVAPTTDTTEAAYAKMAPPKIKPFNISLKDSDDEEEGEAMDTTETEVTKQMINERCRFWPACANGNECHYIHPSIPCKTFPHCRFGDKCMYIHPNCRFDAKCTRMDCPYTHSSKRMGLMAPTVIHKIVQVPMQPYFPPYEQYSSAMPETKQCRFFPNCRNMTCPFTHPKPCRYGIGCMNKSTCPFHHPPLPGKEKLSWSSEKKETSSTSLPAGPVVPQKKTPTKE